MFLPFPKPAHTKKQLYRLNLLQRFLDTDFNKTPLFAIFLVCNQKRTYLQCLFLPISKMTFFFKKNVFSIFCENTPHKTPQIPTFLQLAAENNRKKMQNPRYLCLAKNVDFRAFLSNGTPQKNQFFALCFQPFFAVRKFRGRRAWNSLQYG